MTCAPLRVADSAAEKTNQIMRLADTTYAGANFRQGNGYPPAIAPTTKKGSSPDATASGSGSSGGSCERSREQAKNLTKTRLWCVT